MNLKLIGSWISNNIGSWLLIIIILLIMGLRRK